MSSAEPPPLQLCSFESRRADQMRSLIERQGNVATVVPSMREVPLDENETALDFAQRLLDGQIGVVVFMTGVGARSLLDTAETKFERQEFLTALDACRIAVRGPKPAAVLREWGVHVDCRAAEPNTWRELLAVIDKELVVSGKTVAVQEYGEPNEDFYDKLRQRGADVLPVPVYRWAFPEEQQPLIDAIEATIAGRFDAILFTSAFQLTSVLHTADGIGCRDTWITAANNCVVASIGPTASEALRRVGLTVDVEADPPKMGQLVRAVVAQGRKAGQ
ncbi:MAG: uroporphyrinogen-III synthase [Planctomycetaceae bacterium]|jgi:uroporphyrinogen-III synthase|nr:uroporphyrinogen-III synthase [Planctomycetaceae bacterium]MBT6157847.1 uroporphyrinogen-III synthase [Planctomycetaceae bacterium]MBT6487083.1 uroporphyrinogen-III synthase [Planctomycetaceae bacterium]MBT6496760.1 uroporphyrinogen-III synthase [Planctomycetaceae bacterium]